MWALLLSLAIVGGGIVRDELAGAKSFYSTPAEAILVSLLHEVEIHEADIKPKRCFAGPQSFVGRFGEIHFKTWEIEFYGLRWVRFDQSINRKYGTPAVFWLIRKIESEGPATLYFNRDRASLAKIRRLQSSDCKVVLPIPLRAVGMTKPQTNRFESNEWQLDPDGRPRAEIGGLGRFETYSIRSSERAILKKRGDNQATAENRDVEIRIGGEIAPPVRKDTPPWLLFLGFVGGAVFALIFNLVMERRNERTTKDKAPNQREQ